MIIEAESKDKEQLFELYKMLVPNSKKMNVQEEQIEKLRLDPMNFILVYEEQDLIIGKLHSIFACKPYMDLDHMQ